MSGKTKSICGIVLYENKNKPYGARKGLLGSSYNPSIGHFWNHKSNSDFYATRQVLIKDYGLTKYSASRLFNKKSIIQNGICLYENKNHPFYIKGGTIVACKGLYT